MTIQDGKELWVVFQGQGRVTEDGKALWVVFQGQGRITQGGRNYG